MEAEAVFLCTWTPDKGKVVSFQLKVGPKWAITFLSILTFTQKTLKCCGLSTASCFQSLHSLKHQGPARSLICIHSALHDNTPHTRNRTIIAVYSYIAEDWKTLVDIKGDGKMAENVVRQNLCEVKPDNTRITASAEVLIPVLVVFTFTPSKTKIKTVESSKAKNFKYYRISIN